MILLRIFVVVVPLFFAFTGWSHRLPLMAVGAGIATVGTLAHALIGSGGTLRIGRALLYGGFALAMAQVVAGPSLDGASRTIVRIAPFIDCTTFDRCRSIPEGT